MNIHMISGAILTTFVSAGAILQDPKATAFCYKASDVIGMDVHSAKGDDKSKDIGDIEDLVIDPRSGRIEYAILEIDGRGPDQWHAVPYRALTIANDPESKRGKAKYVINIDGERLKAAPGFPKDKWPDFNAPAWRMEVDKYYADGTARPEATGEYRGVRASTLLEKDLYTTKDEKLGDVEEIAIDPRNARVAYVVVGTGGFLGMGEKQHALPWSLVRTAAMPTDKDKGDKFHVDVTKERLQKAPEFNKNDWMKMSDNAWVTGLYGYYETKPYWSDKDPR